ncbi:histidine kinase dimerization/phosphoacceptor domain -containing protein [Gracilimonas sp.]|uniref:PAS domain-containing sensor histidine kinase n=1 Tax=Gracilimonas sp. TaxID=1974203 RepID=UPI0032F08FF2
MKFSHKDLALEINEWLIHSKSTYLVVTNTKGDIVFANQHYKNSFLHAPESFTALNFKDTLHPTDVESISEGMVVCSNENFKGPLQIINRNRVKNTNRYKSVKWECTKTKNSSQKKNLIIHIGHDLVAVEKEKTANDFSDKTLNTLIDDLQLGVVIQDVDSSILLSNTKAEELLGVTKNDLYGRSVYDEKWDIIKIDGSKFPGDELPAAIAIATKKEVRDVIMGVYNPKEQQYHWFQVDSNPDLDEEGNLERVVTTFIDITKRIEFEREINDQQTILKDALREKTTLLSEIHHRVKNNLAIVSGLLELQSMETDSELKLPLQRSINRIHSIAMVHELMYQTEKLSSVNIKNYLDQLIPAIHRTMQMKTDVEINLDLEDYEVNINQAIPLGLLMNELLTNSFKYAFLKIFDGRIDISMKSDKNHLEFTYQDNGPGFRGDNTFHNSKSLGLNLIQAQLDQLHADYDVVTKGRFKLRFKFEISERGPHSNI